MVCSRLTYSGKRPKRRSVSSGRRRSLQLDLPSHLQETIRRKIEAVRRAHRIAIEKREQHPPPWRQTRRPGTPHHLVVGGKKDGFLKIDQATVLLGAGKRR